MELNNDATPSHVETPVLPMDMPTPTHMLRGFEGDFPERDWPTPMRPGEGAVEDPGEQSMPNPRLDSSTHAILLEIRDRLSTLGLKVQTAPSSAQPYLNPQVQNNTPSRMPKFGDLSNYWVHFDAATKEESDAMINGMKDNLDNLLIFVRVPAPY